MKLSYYKRIFQAYLGGGNSQLSFWHETPALNGQAFEAGSLQYYMTFREKAYYAGPFDDQGVPLLDYRGVIGRQYNPIAIAQWGLGCWNAAQESGVRGQESEEAKEWTAKAMRAADWLVDNLEKNEKGLFVWMHKFDFEYFQALKAPWYSGLAQGQGISLLLRAAQSTGDKRGQGAERYLRAAEQAFEAMVAPINEGGCLFVDDADDWWIEEYITSPPTHILNGFMWAMFGVYDAAFRFQELGVRSQTEELWTQGVVTLERNLGKFDCGFWSMYDLAPLGMKNPASPFYHKLHLVQLEIMYRLSGKDGFRDTLDRWRAYQDSWSYRKRAFVRKVAFKLIHY